MYEVQRSEVLANAMIELNFDNENDRQSQQ